MAKWGEALTVSTNSLALQGSDMARATAVLEENRLHLYDSLKVFHLRPFPRPSTRFQNLGPVAQVLLVFALRCLGTTPFPIHSRSARCASSSRRVALSQKNVKKITDTLSREKTDETTDEKTDTLTSEKHETASLADTYTVPLTPTPEKVFPRAVHVPTA